MLFVSQDVWFKCRGVCAGSRGGLLLLLELSPPPSPRAGLGAGVGGFGAVVEAEVAAGIC